MRSGHAFVTACDPTFHALAAVEVEVTDSDRWVLPRPPRRVAAQAHIDEPVEVRHVPNASQAMRQTRKPDGEGEGVTT